jgi:NRPS condensation-like uncharacterized protein
MDRALLALHSKDEPMLLHGMVSIDGAVDPERLRSALSAVLRRRPRLRSIIRGARLRPAPEPGRADAGGLLSVWDADATPASGREGEGGTGPGRERRLVEWINQPLDPRRALPWKVLLLRETPGRASLVFTFHHALVDGVSALRLVREVIREYNGSGDDPEVPEPPVVSRSDELMALARSCRRRVGHFNVRITAWLAHRFLVAPLLPRARICRRTSKPSPRISLCQGRLDAAELRQVRSGARSVGVTLNDVLLAACFRTVERWNRDHGRASGKISIMVPVDIGGVRASPGPANQVSYISVPTTRKERSDPAELARRVGRKTSRMLENGMAFTMVYAAYLCTRVPPRVSRCIAWLAMSTRVGLDTVLLTNVGRVWPRDGAATERFRIGGGRVTGVAVIPPVASPMGLSLSTAISGGLLHVTLAYKCSHLSAEQARAFLGSYLEQLRDYQALPEAAEHGPGYGGAREAAAGRHGPPALPALR